MGDADLMKCAEVFTDWEAKRGCQETSEVDSALAAAYSHMPATGWNVLDCRAFCDWVS